MKKNIIIIIIILIVLAGIIGGIVFFFVKAKNVVTNQNQSNLNANAALVQNTNQENLNTNSDENLNITSASTNTEVTYTGMVFLKGYKTPSESYGISTAEGHEIGLGKYDSMKEQLRPYVGEKVKVTFSQVCRSTSPGCCRTLFFNCGTVKSWEPVER